MTIEVEFFGIPRARAGVASLSVLPGCHSATIGEILRELAIACPEFAESCLSRERELLDGYVISVDGRCFVSDAELAIKPEQTVLILSADAGG